MISLDFETASPVDLRRTGVSRYARHPDTRPVCLAWAGPSGDPDLWLPGEPCPQDLIEAISRGELFRAWNANFEVNIWRHVMVPRHGWPDIPDDQWSCTMAVAMYNGLPASLDMAAPALGLGPEHQKDANGKALMRLFMSPVYTEAGMRWPADDPANADALVDYYAYCLQDVVTERAIAQALPVAFPAQERKIWLLDQKMNARGMAIDLGLVRRMHALAASARARLDQRMAQLTKGQVPNTRKRTAFLGFVAGQMDLIDLVDRPELLDPQHAVWRKGPNARRATLEALRKSVEGPVIEEALDIWLDGARTSPAKLDALLASVDDDSLLRCTLRYYGAGRTGRWAGSGVQLQNLPKPVIKLVAESVALIEDGADVDEIDSLCEDRTLAVIASCLRSCFVAPEGELLACADLAQIEARVLAWLAGQDDVTQVFERREDIYIYTATSVGSDNRQLGKIIRLALGFGMGHIKFAKTTEQFGIALSEQQATNLVRGFREASSRIVQLWWDLDRVMRSCIGRGPGSVAPWDRRDTAGATLAFSGHRPVAFQHLLDGTVAMILPSGRSLMYRNCRLEPKRLYDEAGKLMGEDPEYTEIVYDGVNPRTRKWGAIRTYGGKLAENVTQAVARDVMAESMLALDRRGHNLVLTCHDEIIATAPEAEAPARLAEMLAVMRRPLAWAPGLPVDAEGYCARRYRK